MKKITAVFCLFICALFSYADNIPSTSSLEVPKNETSEIAETIFIHNDSEESLEAIQIIWYSFIRDFVRNPKKIAQFLRRPNEDLSYKIGEKTYIIKHHLVLKWLYEGNAFQCTTVKSSMHCDNPSSFSHQYALRNRSNRILASIIPNRNSFSPLSTQSDLVFKNAVLLFIMTKDGLAGCSGIALNRFTILTANHCLRHKGVPSYLKYVYFFGSHAKEHIIARGQDWRDFRFDRWNSTSYTDLIEEGILTEPVDFSNGDISHSYYHKDQNGTFVSEMPPESSFTIIHPTEILSENIKELYRPFFYNYDDGSWEGLPAFKDSSFTVTDASLIVTETPIVPTHYLFPQISEQLPIEEARLLNYGFTTQSLQKMLKPSTIADDFYYKRQDIAIKANNASLPNQSLREEIFTRKADIGASHGDSGSSLYHYNEKQKSWDVQGVLSMASSLPDFVELVIDEISVINLNSFQKDDEGQETCSHQQGSKSFRDVLLMTYKDKSHMKEVGDFLYNTTKNERYHPTKRDPESLYHFFIEHKNGNGEFCLVDHIEKTILDIVSSDFRRGFQSSELLAFALAFKEGNQNFCSFSTVHKTNLNDFLIQMETKIIEDIYTKYGRSVTNYLLD